MKHLKWTPNTPTRVPYKVISIRYYQSDTWHKNPLDNWRFDRLQSLSISSFICRQVRHFVRVYSRALEFAFYFLRFGIGGELCAFALSYLRRTI